MNIKTNFKKFFQNFALRSWLVVNRIPPNEDLVNVHNIDIPISLPHPLDQSNIQNISEIVMPEIWWKK